MLHSWAENITISAGESQASFVDLCNVRTDGGVEHNVQLCCAVLFCEILVMRRSVKPTELI